MIEKTEAQAPAAATRDLTDEELALVAGGLNPQPLPPRLADRALTFQAFVVAQFRAFAFG
jgi:hypothetical protein